MLAHNDQMSLIECRDIRPSGAVISYWVYAPGYETGPGYHPGFYPSPPFERQERAPGGEWVTVQVYSEDGNVETRHPDGRVFMSRIWWE